MKSAIASRARSRSCGRRIHHRPERRRRPTLAFLGWRLTSMKAYGLRSGLGLSSLPGRSAGGEAGLPQVLTVASMRRIKLTLSYDGTDYNGWQVQPGLPTIQGFLEAAFLDIEKKPVHVAGSGRTDAGVHALAQVAAVSINNPIPDANLKKALNRLLASRYPCH